MKVSNKAIGGAQFATWSTKDCTLSLILAQNMKDKAKFSML